MGQEREIVLNWDWFQALYTISGFILVFSLLWKVVEKIFILLIALLFNENAGLLFANIFSLIPYYLIASFSALIVLGIGEGKVNLLIAILIGFFILINDLLGLIQAKREAEKEFDYSTIRILNYRYIFIILELIFYVAVLIEPSFAINKVNESVINIVTWVRDIPFLSILIAIGAVIYAIYIIFMGLAAVLVSIASIFKRDSLSQ